MNHISFKELSQYKYNKKSLNFQIIFIIFVFFVLPTGFEPVTHSLGLMMGFEPTNDIGLQNKFATNRLYPLAT